MVAARAVSTALGSTSMWREGRSEMTTNSETYCHRCGGPNVAWSAPSPLWNAVMRGGSIDGEWQWEEIICPTCFAVLAEAAGIAGVWRLDADQVHVELETVTPTGRVWNDALRLWVQPEPSAHQHSNDPQTAAMIADPAAYFAKVREAMKAVSGKEKN